MNVIENLEHPMIAELRQQMQEQKEEHERREEEIKDELQYLKDETDYVYSSLRDLVKYKKDGHGKCTNEILPIKLSDLIEATKSANKNTKSEASDIPYQLLEVLENIELPNQIEYKTEYVAEIPSDVKKAMRDLSDVIDKYI